MINALSSGLAGMNAMQNQINLNATAIARNNPNPSSPSASSNPGNSTSPASIVSLSGNQSTTGGDSLATNLVGMKESTLLYQANAQTVKTADQTLGTLLQAKA
jgi:hypothetical protein